MVDQRVISDRLSRLERVSKRLAKIADVSDRDFVGDLDLRDIAERNLQVGIQCCIDIGGHLVSDLQLGTPSSYAEVFDLLAESDIIPEEFAPQLRKMVGFRNILVHDYLDLNEDRVLAAVRSYEDLNRFAQYVKEAVQRETMK